MAKKPVTKKKTTAAKPKARRRPRAVSRKVEKMTGGVVVGGSLKVGRDMVMRDQYNWQAAQIASPQDFVSELERLRAQIAELKREPELTPAQVRRVEVVEADVQDALQEAQKPQPLGARINTTLDGAKETMTKLGEGVQAAVGLGATLAGLGQMALRLFGAGG